MAYHFEQGVFGGDDNIDFGTPSNCMTDGNPFDTSCSASEEMFGQVGMYPDNDFWGPNHYLPSNTEQQTSLLSFANASQTPQPISMQEYTISSTRLPDYSPNSEFSSSTISSANMTLVERESPMPKRKSILQQLIDEDSPVASPRPIASPKLTPKPKRKYTRRQKKESTASSVQQFTVPTSMRVYEENWLNEVYWYHFDDFMKANCYPMAQQSAQQQDAMFAQSFAQTPDSDPAPAQNPESVSAHASWNAAINNQPPMEFQ